MNGEALSHPTLMYLVFLGVLLSLNKLILNHFIDPGIVKTLNPTNVKSYSEYQLVRASPLNEDQQNVINQWKATDKCKSIKKYKILGQPTDFLCINSVEAGSLEKFLAQHGIAAQIVFNDLNREEQEFKSFPEDRQPLNDAISFDKYNRYDELMDYLERISADEKYSEFFEIDWSDIRSHEERRLPVVKIGNSPLGANTRSVWIDAGIHAREWISTATATYIIDSLLRAFSADDNEFDNTDLNSIDYYIMPLVNPDGYEYSHMVDRMWRKNRAPPSPGSNCFGVDLNRNYDVAGYGIGASQNPCEEIYQGASRNSEPEVQRASEFVRKNSNNIRASLSLHSHGQVILTSWGYKSELPTDNEKLIYFGNQIKDAIYKTSGRSYQVGPAAVIFYAAGGASDDFAKAEGGIPYAATIELPDGPYGNFGFRLPASQIRSVGEEIFQALIPVAKLVRDEPLGPNAEARLG